MAKNEKSFWGLILPSEKAFTRTAEFIKKYPTATHKEYLRRFAALYGDKISAKKFADVLIHLFNALEE